jgi:hypothetical protein
MGVFPSFGFAGFTDGNPNWEIWNLRYLIGLFLFLAPVWFFTVITLIVGGGPRTAHYPPS